MLSLDRRLVAPYLAGLQTDDLTEALLDPRNISRLVQENIVPGDVECIR